MEPFPPLGVLSGWSRALSGQADAGQPSTVLAMKGLVHGLFLTPWKNVFRVFLESLPFETQLSSWVSQESIGIVVYKMGTSIPTSQSWWEVYRVPQEGL